VACIAADAVGGRHVTGVSMPSRFTADESQQDARSLATALGATLLTLPIEGLAAGYRATLAATFQGREVGVAEENLQARVRGNLLMALSNVFGWLVLVTGNKSEIAVGYSTLYGDTAGGFAVLKDVYKTQVYALAQYRNRRGGAPVIPEFTLTRPPSAELRPAQTDQDSLPPYDLLDPVLKLMVEDDKPLGEIAALGYEPAMLERVAGMVRAAEWKRRQMPPGVKVTQRAFGKDWRMPVTDRWRGRAG
jgi:NAD+ synthase (glutamine-hydrolysing)